MEDEEDWEDEEWEEEEGTVSEPSAAAEESAPPALEAVEDLEGDADDAAIETDNVNEPAASTDASALPLEATEANAETREALDEEQDASVTSATMSDAEEATVDPVVADRAPSDASSLVSRESEADEVLEGCPKSDAKGSSAWRQTANAEEVYNKQYKYELEHGTRGPFQGCLHKKCFTHTFLSTKWLPLAKVTVTWPEPVIVDTVYGADLEAEPGRALNPMSREPCLLLP
mmetsp:Transcript_21576/g.55243  ORF Transcript_21576/g.55243 Transcript_21576/m.55243 type:complete len:231 (-) Transcript_21576:541-1233(-)